MNQQTANEPEQDERVRYVAAFLSAAWGGVNAMFTQPRCRIKSFGVDGEAAVHATTVGRHRGRQWRFRRQIWPPAHPAMLAAQLYTTSLEERLNTGRLGAGDGDVVDL
ncbi:hypothetical protein LO763_25600 [Glycomyces sp. A-F 0318]|uniref:hypothetical protein n=1 Tax=Glycomyces amatae TaxID=2881355 RepID=UPI001E318681|nr:hypothetical protein [Glycomyces amatae]MCD0446997.1 hypothetical protein [Glycomyces amatae]